MAYQALYRKYRPIDFSDVYGQDHIVNTLKNEIKSGKIAHAYLFCGSRGTGKTTAAKIFSRAVNCPNNASGEPCNQCPVCEGILKGSIMDVIEMDAASNNGVDDVRQIRDEVAYAPSGTNYKIYIIDEVHMLSNAAFNALLKTLEEPPPHIIFILATTEPHKIPATILSRCQKFDFKRIKSEDIVKRLTEIATAENISLTPSAAQLIASYAEGGMRDALSLLDQCNSFVLGEINDEVVFDLIGYAGKSAIFEFAEYCKNYDVANAVTLINNLYMQGRDPLTLIDQLIEFFKNLLVTKATDGAIASLSDHEKYAELSQGFTMERLYNMIQTLSDYFIRARQASKAKIILESGIIKICHKSFDIASLQGRIEKLENAIKTGSVLMEEKPSIIKSEPLKETIQEETINDAKDTPLSDTTTQEPEQLTKDDLEPPIDPVDTKDNTQSSIINHWNVILDSISDKDCGLFYATLKKSEFRVNDNRITLFFEPIELALIENDENKTILIESVYDVCNIKVDVEFLQTGETPLGEPEDKFKDLTNTLIHQLGDRVHIKE